MHPTSYLMKQDKNGNTVFPSLASDSHHKLSQLVEDSGYSNATAKAYDLSWQAYKKGYLATNERINKVEPLSVYDNYYFLRKYFKPHWSDYVLLISILGFKNSLKKLSFVLQEIRLQLLVVFPIQFCGLKPTLKMTSAALDTRYTPAKLLRANSAKILAIW